MASRLLILLFIGVQLQGFAQQDAWVYFSDKEQVETSLANPTTILSQKAIERKQRFGIKIDARDVPVNEAYITTLKALDDVLVLAKSKWFNAVHVRGSETAIRALLNFSFVSEIVFADKTLASTAKIVSTGMFFKQTSTSEFVYGDTANQVEMIQVNALHENNFTGTGITVAILDAGFPNVNTISGFQNLRTHNNILGVYDFVARETDVYDNTKDEHGTLVLSTMAGYIENTFVGTAPDASYYLFITEDTNAENPLEESLWVEAAERADSLGVDIINSSLGYKSFDNPNYDYSNEDLDGKTAFITQGANIAAEKGILVVTSAGNSGTSGVGAPADSEAVFSIGAVDASGEYAYFSSQGSAIQPSIKPDVTAQGLGSVVINKTNQIETVNGTSLSAPILAGGLACLWQALPELSSTALMELVRASSSQYNNPDYLLGYGIPNLATAYNNGILSVSDVTTGDKLSMYPNPTQNHVFFNTTLNGSDLHIKVFDVLGKCILTETLETNESLDVSVLKNGIYLLQISTRNRTVTKKLIKN
ncbi:S8 family serine peptidase [Formosa sediminum]|uniref:S8 family serine peptidase n=1 Tax=Formosa sediminum TaxID=2594004 RepID=A0A516GRV7_9FLAO|nr:S8 family serine peptidase [Formosa sediminum]QDO94100.1 S8 family serine peptidase [Formosa sediminum]